MLQNAYFLAKIGADTAENEQHFAEILRTDACPTLARAARRAPTCPPTVGVELVDERLEARDEVEVGLAVRVARRELVDLAVGTEARVHRSDLPRGHARAPQVVRGHRRS